MRYGSATKQLQNGHGTDDTQTIEKSRLVQEQSNGTSNEKIPRASNSNSNSSLLDPGYRLDQDKKNNTEVVPDPPSATADLTIPLTEITTAWNTMAEKCGLPKMATWSAKRKTTLRARWKDPWFRENWRASIEKIPTMPFLTGANDRQWRASIDFFLQDGRAARVFEGVYGAGGGETYVDEDIPF